MATIDTHTGLCAVIGNPVGHSLSPALHNAAFAATGLNYVYLAFEVADVAACLAGMRALPSFRGMSVTIPHKLAVIPYLDEVDAMARDVGSVNTIVNHGGQLLGLSTDGPGTVRAFADAGVTLTGKRVLFLGTGGAVRAVAFAFAHEPGCAGVTILGRTPEHVKALVRDLRDRTACEVAGGALAEGLEGAVAAHDVIVQGTPVGMFPERMDETLVPGSSLRPEQVVFDMVYRPMQTRLLREALERGCTVIHGLEMLLNQAALQFEAWTGIEAPREVMRGALFGALVERT